MTPRSLARFAALALLVPLVALSACNRGGNAPAPEAGVEANPLLPTASGSVFNRNKPAPDFSERIATVDSLRVDNSPSGAIILASGTAAHAGAFNAALRVPKGQPAISKGVLQLEFVAIYPDPNAPASPARSRQITAAYSVTKQTLAEIRSVRVLAAGNSREARRR